MTDIKKIQELQKLREIVRTKHIHILSKLRMWNGKKTKP